MIRPVLALLVAAVSAGAAWAAEPHLPVGDPVYERLERLAAQGLINDHPLGTKPLSVGALGLIAIELRGTAGPSPDPWIAADVRAIEARLDTLGRGRSVIAAASWLAGEPPAVPVGLERNGDRLEPGGNGRFALETGGRPAAWMAWGLSPEFRVPVGPEQDLDLRMRSAYVALTAGRAALTVGREPMWWGPGFRGALLLTDTARPFDQVRLESSRPWRVRWIGPMTAHLFVTRLERDRTGVPEPYLAGLRVAFRPAPPLEFGLSRTAMFGGDGRPLTADVVWDVIRAKGENDPAANPGNQLLSLDATLRVPWRRQPVALYAEWGGEDEANSQPSHPAVVAGVRLPRLLGDPRRTLRAEYADNALSKVPGVWYQHAVYAAGYTYHGIVIGHPMGTDARMATVELDHRVTPEWTVTASYDAMQSGVYGTSETSGRSGGLRVRYEPLIASASLGYRYSRVERPTGRRRDGGHLLEVSFRAAW